MHNYVNQGWAINGPRATCGSPQSFQWPAEAFRNNHQVLNFLELVTVNVSVQANLNRDLILFLLEQHFSTRDREACLGRAKISM